MNSVMERTAAIVRGGAILLLIATFFVLLPACSKSSWQEAPWLDANGESWAAFKLDLPDRTSVLFVCRQAGNLTSEYEQGIVFSGSSRLSPLPYDVGGGIDIEAFWHERIGESGPFVRLRDRQGEYLIDREHQATFQIVRKDGRVFVGRISDPSGGCSYVGSGREMKVFVGENCAKELTDALGEGDLFARIRR